MKLEKLDEFTQKQGKEFEKPHSEDGNTQKPFIENIRGIQSLRDTLTITRRGKSFAKLVEKSKSDASSNSLYFKSLRESRISIRDEEYDITPDIQADFTKTNFTTEPTDNEDQSTVYDILGKNRFLIVDT